MLYFSRAVMCIARRARRVLKHIVLSQLINNASTNKILHDLQHDFCSTRSCDTQLLGFVDGIQSTMSGNKPTDVIILDFAKAFDKVEHNDNIIQFFQLFYHS